MFRSAKSRAYGQDGCESHFHGNASINERADSDSDERAHTSANGHPDDGPNEHANHRANSDHAGPWCRKRIVMAWRCGY